MATIMDSMTVKPLSDALGVEVSGVNAADLGEATFKELREIFHENLVVVVKDQDLSPAEQTEFAQRFGEIQYHISPEYLMDGQPEVMILSNEKEDGKFIGLPDGGSEWHSDHSYVDQPTGYTMLHAIKVPKDGGDTEWTNMVKAYETLSDEMKERLEGVIGIHSFNRLKNQRLTVPVRHMNDPDYYKRSPPDAFHPIARTHPHTGKKALYISPRFTIGIKDMDDTEAQPLLDKLFAHIKNRDFIYRHRWTEGDLLMWDNRTTLHLALLGVPEGQARRMHRTTVLGEIPF
ncbi:MAG: taurine catabolism dioxygenase TauD [Rhodospirillaceae bacterium]|nr:taurine catabolism dioxygenase TauD [Rhodospirillaceae bacterium]|tara:strand:+ start:56869 stop:57735 length:867 start_codon:yes stop_codon:yes gene_type:complete